MSEKESQTYQSMLEEVEAIVERIGNQNGNLDQMVEQVEQGYGLIRQMREKLDSTRMRIEKMRSDFEAASTPTETSE